jgi:DNA-directed RNA polymerase subunit beta
MLTIKSDDVKGRNMAYSSIIKKMPFPEPRTPESFKLLTKYLQGLGIGMEIEFSDKSVQDVNEYVSTIKSDENTNEGGIIK